jgi:hypothetical protein
MTALTDSGLSPRRISKAAGVRHGDEISITWCWTIATGDLRLVIQFSRHAQGFALAALSRFSVSHQPAQVSISHSQESLARRRFLETVARN